MPISHALWTVDAKPAEVSRGTLANEQPLEDHRPDGGEVRWSDFPGAGPLLRVPGDPGKA